MDEDTILLFTQYGMGHGPEPLQKQLAVKFLSLLLESGQLPAKILLYTEGVWMATEGSPTLPSLQELAAQGVEIILCKTCVDYLDVAEMVKTGVVGGMPDILEAIQKAAKVISL